MKKIGIFILLLVPLFIFSNEINSRLVISNNYNFVTNHKIAKDDKSVALYSNDGTAKETDKLDINYKNENLIRRAEIIFFGSMTFVSFMGWLMFSAYNSVIYAETFGTLKRYQFLTLYLGSSVVAFSVSLSDLFIRLKPFFKRVEIY